MTHVRITSADYPGVYNLTVDGIDMSKMVLSEGFGIELGRDPGDPARVTMVIAADVLDVDLPEAVLDAMRQDAAEVTVEQADAR